MDYNLDIPDIYAFDIEKTDNVGFDNKIIVNEIKNINGCMFNDTFNIDKKYKIFKVIIPTKMIIIIKTNYKLEIVMLHGNSYIPVYNNFIYFCQGTIRFCVNINKYTNNGNIEKLSDYIQLYPYNYHKQLYPYNYDKYSQDISNFWINLQFGFDYNYNSLNFDSYCNEYSNINFDSYYCNEYSNINLLKKISNSFCMAFIIIIKIDTNQQIPEFIKLYSSDLEFTYKTYRYNNIVNSYLVSIRNILNNDLIKFNIFNNKLNPKKIFKKCRMALNDIIYFIDKYYMMSEIYYIDICINNINNKIKGECTLFYFGTEC
jgi:hypothetical protein